MEKSNRCPVVLQDSLKCPATNRTPEAKICDREIGIPPNNRTLYGELRSLQANLLTATVPWTHRYARRIG
ncbi:MAG: hypothetical protein HC866_22690 [Leptolyngbyaceae cyanobacterium RU_5_1]|nr:hypothetical protein [Leptolyngbyaceae cyanobacterium RU_5_1]